MYQPLSQLDVQYLDGNILRVYQTDFSLNSSYLGGRKRKRLENPLPSKGQASLKVSLSPQIKIQNSHGEVLSEDVKLLLNKKTGAFKHVQKHASNSIVLGLGEKTGSFNRNGRRFRISATDCMNYDAEKSDPLYKHWPFFIVYEPDRKITYGIFYDNHSDAVVDLGCEIHAYQGPYRYYESSAGDFDFYFIPGENIQEVVRKFHSLIGGLEIPPHWSLNYLGSTMSYTDSDDPSKAVDVFLENLKRHNICCKAFYLSSGYSMDDQGQRQVFEWNRSKIKDPKTFTSQFKEAGLNVIANIKPGFLRSHPAYEKLATSNLFVRSISGKPSKVTFWGGEASLMDFTNPKACEWWKTQIKEQLIANGVHSVWNDNNEFQSDLQDEYVSIDEKTYPLHQLRGLMPLLMNQASYEALEETGVSDSLMLTRSGCPGTQRFAQTWTGDNYSSWESLRHGFVMGLNLSLSGWYNFGHDVGGFGGPKPGPELFLRWIQSGIVHPRFCIHSWNSDSTTNEPWMYADEMPKVQRLFKFRDRLVRFLYSLFVQAKKQNDPIIRPLVYDFQDDPRSFAVLDQAMLGPDLLFKLCLEERMTEGEVYFPPAKYGWWDLYHDKVYESKSTHQFALPLDRLNLFLRKGAMLATELDNRLSIYLSPDIASTLELFYGEDEQLKISCNSQGSVQIDWNSKKEFPIEEIDILTSVHESRKIELSSTPVATKILPVMHRPIF